MFFTPNGNRSPYIAARKEKKPSVCIDRGHLRSLLSSDYHFFFFLPAESRLSESSPQDPNRLPRKGGADGLD